MLGTIIGDIAGSQYEILEYNAIKTPNKKRSFEERTKILDPETPLLDEHSSYTDDTVLTMAIASSILKKEDYEKSIRSFGIKEMDYGKDLYGHSCISTGFVNWLKDETPNNSYNNGAAMRISPIAYYYDDLSQILDETKKVTIPSHNNNEALKGAQAVSSAIYLARTKHPKEEIKKIYYREL